MENLVDMCPLCGKSLDQGDFVQVSKGLDTILQSSFKRNDGVHKKIEGKQSIKVHKKCRKDYTRPSSIAAAVLSSKVSDTFLPSTSTRQSVGEEFDFKTNCFICGNSALVTSKTPADRRKDIRVVATLEIKKSFLEKCDERGDGWGEKVKARLLNVSDLVAPEARYHKACHKTFSSSEVGPVGRPATAESRFSKLCDYIDHSDECQFTIRELQDLMSKITGEPGTYSDLWLKKLLLKKYEDRILVSNVSGKKNIICLSDTAHRIIDSWYKDREIDKQAERLRIVMAAADIIKEDIQKMTCDTQSYPGVNEIKSGDEKLIPESLALFTSRVTKKRTSSGQSSIQRKRIVINHAIVSAVRPRSFLSSVQLGLSLTLHRLFGSKHLINMLNSMGICTSYSETAIYLNSLTTAGSPAIKEDAFIQHVFDNADVNVRTLDGLNTFHAMGGIQCITPKSSVEIQTKVDRIASGTFNAQKINFKSYANKQSRVGLKNVTVCGYSQLTTQLNVCGDFNSSSLFPHNTIWLSGVKTQPGWNGYMQIIHQSEDVLSSYIMALPFINMDASNMSTILSALTFASEQSRKRNQSCIVTFDQPLFLKASEIVSAAEENSDVSKIIVRLGGFHLLMSFMGSVGLIMEESGLESLWETVYGSNTVQNMINGHAYARCIRAYTLTASAIFSVITNQDEKMKEDVITLEKFNKLLISHEIEPEDALAEKDVIEACKRIDTAIKHIASSSRTAKLWINLLKCIDLILQFIYAERSGDWNMHLKTTLKMLPFFHAAGHLPYAKSAHLYVQKMTDIQSQLTAREFELFTSKGLFTVRRGKKLWSGTWTDMCIEQSLMRPMKSVGGLTHGRGITESTLQKWIHGTPYFLKVHEAIEDFLGTAVTFSEQHVEIRESRKKRDKADSEKFTEWLKAHNPFTKLSGELISLASGCVSDETVNCHEAFEVGIAAMEKMQGKNFGELHLQRKDKVKTQAKQKKVKIRSQEVTVNSQQLFNRILCVCDSPLKLKEYLSYELASRPPSIFDDVSIRKGTKSSIMKIFETGIEDRVDTSDASYVVDGGFFIHFVKWPENSTYGDIVHNYCDYAVSKYGENVTVVFDGYPEIPTTKNEEQIRRASQKTSSEILFDKTTRCSDSKENFLGNKKNKKKLLQAVSQEMQRRGVTTHQAEEDADYDIVNVALQMATENKEVVVVGTDTDLLVMLVALAHPEKKLYFCKPKSGQNNTMYNVRRLVQDLNDIRDCLPFAHAMTGCDTTSSFFGLGKLKGIDMLKSSIEAKKQALIFNSSNISKEQLILNGELFVLGLYGMDRCKNLNEARYFKFVMMTKKAALRSNFDLARLPPTTEACQQQSLRVYLQVQRWMGRKLLPTEWGWKLESAKEFGGEKKVLKPVTSLKPLAPNELLQLVSCSCKQACGNYCGCRKLGLHCSSMCEHCNGLSCHNTSTIEEDQDQEDQDEDYQ